MKIRYKIVIVAAIIPIVVFGFFLLGPVLLMITGNTVAGFIISNTSNEDFEDDFTNIPEVALFLEKYPNYTTSHLSDIIGWKIIMYQSEIADNKSVNLHVKKNVLHQGIRVSAGCNQGGSGFTFDIPQEQVMDYLKNEECLRK